MDANHPASCSSSPPVSRVHDRRGEPVRQQLDKATEGLLLLAPPVFLRFRSGGSISQWPLPWAVWTRPQIYRRLGQPAAAAAARSVQVSVSRGDDAAPRDDPQHSRRAGRGAGGAESSEPGAWWARLGERRDASSSQMRGRRREEAAAAERPRGCSSACLQCELPAFALRDVASICPLAEQTQPLLPAASPCRASPAEPELHARRWSLQRCAAYLTRPTALNLQPATPKQQQHDLTAHHALPHRHPRRVLVLRGVGVTRALSPSPHASFPQPAVHPCDRGP